MASVKQFQVTFDAQNLSASLVLVRGVGVRRTAATGGVCYLGRFRALPPEHQGSAFA
jgi:hypothetical protein